MLRLYFFGFVIAGFLMALVYRLLEGSLFQGAIAIYVILIIVAIPLGFIVDLFFDAIWVKIRGCHSND